MNSLTDSRQHIQNIDYIYNKKYRADNWKPVTEPSNEAAAFIRMFCDQLNALMYEAYLRAGNIMGARSGEGETGELPAVGAQTDNAGNQRMVTRQPSERKNSGLMGPRTRTMMAQLRKFEKFVDEINEKARKRAEEEKARGLSHDLIRNRDKDQNKTTGRSTTIGALANAFWIANSKEMEEASRCRGERKGYASYKALADAYRKRHLTPK